MPRRRATGSLLADLYTEDATYGWNLGPKGEFMAVGRDEIRDIALGLEMGGLDGWTYPYEEILIDDRKGQVIGFWRQVADAKRADGTPYEVAGIGGSWFRYARQLAVVVAARLLRLRQRRRAVHGDVSRRHAVGGDDQAHGPLAGRPPPRPLQAGRGTRRALGGALVMEGLDVDGGQVIR